MPDLQTAMARSKGLKQVLSERKNVSLRKKGRHESGRLCCLLQRTAVPHATLLGSIAHKKSGIKRERRSKIQVVASCSTMFRCNVTSNCFDYLVAIARNFSNYTDIKISVSTGRRYIKKLRIFLTLQYKNRS